MSDVDAPPAAEPQAAAGSEPLHADFYSAAVYGSIVAAALVAAFREEDASPKTIALSLLSTMAVFWLVHVWSAIVGERIQLGTDFRNHHLAVIARAEWPLVEAAFAPAAVLALGWAGVLGERTASALAIAVCILQLFGWGIFVGRRAYDHWWTAALSGFTNGVLGIVLVALEILVVH
jgi:hypothetical protein